MHAVLITMYTMSLSIDHSSHARNERLARNHIHAALMARAARILRVRVWLLGRCAYVACVRALATASPNSHVDKHVN